MTTLTRILAAVDQLRQQLQDVRLDHPWDRRTRENVLRRLLDVRADLNAVWSDVSVAEKRQGEDGPCCDPLTDEPIEVTVSEPCDVLDREVERAQCAVNAAAEVLANPTPETQANWVELRDSCGVIPEMVTFTTSDGKSRKLTRQEREQLFGCAQEPAPQPITEALMRAAQVGWVAVNVRGDFGEVDTVSKDSLIIDYGDVIRAQYFHKRCGYYGSEGCHGKLDIVSLAPPDVVAELDEVLK